MNAPSSTGGVANGETFVLLEPRNYSRDTTRPGVLHAHQSGAAPQDIFGTATPVMDALTRGIAECWPVLLTEQGGVSNWGAAAAVTSLGNAKTLLQSTYGAKAGAVAGTARSMGFLGLCNKAKANPTHISCLVAFLPVVDPNDVVTNNRGGFAAAVNTAYSTYVEATHGATYNPTTYGASLAGLPMQLWYATDDTVAMPERVLAFAALVGASVELHTLTGGHTDAACAGVDIDRVRNFILAHA